MMNIINEPNLRELVENRLSNYFYLDREVPGINEQTCQKGRIDLIISHKKYENAVFGIEFKRTGHKSPRYTAEWLRQAGGYAQMIFKNNKGKNYGRVPVFVCPPISGIHLNFCNHRDRCQDTETNRFLFHAFNVGELRSYQSSYFNSKRIGLWVKGYSVWAETAGGSVDYERECLYRENEFNDLYRPEKISHNF